MATKYVYAVICDTGRYDNIRQQVIEVHNDSHTAAAAVSDLTAKLMSIQKAEARLFADTYKKPYSAKAHREWTGYKDFYEEQLAIEGYRVEKVAFV